ncbi:MAG: hypothetical protein ACKOXP_03450 [Flavobacteriales bacterium]
MKKILMSLLFMSHMAQAQWRSMQRFEEFGIGNFYLFTVREVDAKRLIAETLNDNDIKGSISFRKNSNLLFNFAIQDNQNSEYVYIIHCIRGVKNEVPGYHIFCYYMENRYRYFYDVSDPDGRISLIFDPSILNVSPNSKKNK